MMDVTKSGKLARIEISTNEDGDKVLKDTINYIGSSHGDSVENVEGEVIILQ